MSLDFNLFIMQIRNGQLPLPEVPLFFAKPQFVRNSSQLKNDSDLFDYHPHSFGQKVRIFDPELYFLTPSYRRHFFLDRQQIAAFLSIIMIIMAL